MTTRQRLACVLACTVLGGTLAAAQTPGSSVPPQPSIAAGVTPPGPPATAQPIPPSRWTVAQIRQSFDLADTNGDGQLSRAEAQRLAIMPRQFEDMDQNKDGVVTRQEYEASFNATP